MQAWFTAFLIVYPALKDYRLNICEITCRKLHIILIPFFIDIVYNIVNGNSAGTWRKILPVPALEPNEHNAVYVHLAYGLMGMKE